MNIAPPPMRAARTVSWMDTTYRINIANYHSGGVAGVFEAAVPSRGGPPVHVHHNEDEVIHVLEGDYEFWLDGEIIPVSAGGSIFLPRGVPHTFRVKSAAPGRNLTVAMPGGLEEFFVEAATRNLQLPADMTAVVELAGRFGVEVRGPAKWPD